MTVTYRSGYVRGGINKSREATYRVGEEQIAKLKDRLEDADRKEALERLRGYVDNDCVKAFLAALAEALADASDHEEFDPVFAETAEEHIASGPCAAPDCPLVRIVHAVDFLWWHSRKFIKDEHADRRATLRSELDKIQAMLRCVDETDLPDFLRHELELKGTLRERGHALWLTTEEDISDCQYWEDYRGRLALGEHKQGRGFRLTILLHNIGSTPNFPETEDDYNPDDKMSVREPTPVDGMYWEQWAPGGSTHGGATEHVSRLNNTEAIDNLEVIPCR